VIRQRRSWVGLISICGLAALGCGRGERCDRCESLVIAATGQPQSVLPALVVETVGRDISDQVFERLADLRPGPPTLDPAAFQPRLAARWERVDSLTWRFHLRPGARWSDGQALTAEDVAFSFEAFSDSAIDAPARPYLQGKLKVVVEDGSTFLVRFGRVYAEQLYDATYHVRVMPKHIWGGRPKESWVGDTALDLLVGSGPYRLIGWTRGQALTLEAVLGANQHSRIRRLVWRFMPDPDAALDLVLSHEADVLESVVGADRLRRLSNDDSIVQVRYPSAAYGFLGYHLATEPDKPQAILGDRRIRRALTLAVDRSTVARSVYGNDVKVPPGPMSQVLWIWDDSIKALGYDTAEAGHLLDQAGWSRGRNGLRTQAGRPLAFDILVPGTSPTRRQIAEALQEAWRRVGARVSIVAVDFPVFQQRLARGQFDAYVGAWLDEPSPRGLADQWTREGWGALNYGHYANARFDSLFARAAGESDVGRARLAWREAMDTLNADAPALFLYAPTNVAAVSRRLRGVTLDPYSWLSRLSEWSLATLDRQ